MSVCKFYNAMCRGYLFALIPHISNEPMSGTLSTQPLDDPRKACHSNMSPGKQGKLCYKLFFLRSIAQFFTQIYMNCFDSS